MSQSPTAAEPDFDFQMRSLAEEAQQFLDVGEGTAAVPAAASAGSEKKGEPGLLDFLRPLLQRLESLGQIVTENTMAIMRLEEASAVQAKVPHLLTSVQGEIEQKSRLNQKLFDALHDELRSYKDGFLLDVMHRPIARDLITLFDDLTELHRQADLFLQKTASTNPEIAAAQAQVRNLNTNLDHVTGSLLEILARMDVHRAEPSCGKLDKHTQRVLNVQPASSPEEDFAIASSVKPGFIWRERTFRPEEVIVKRWRREEETHSQK